MRHRAFSRRALRRFMPGEDVEAALTASAAFAERGITTVLTQLGEDLRDPDEARAVTAHYLEVLAAIHERQLPTHLSVKPTQFGLDIDRVLCRDQLARLADAAAARNNTLWVDMEATPQLVSTLELFHDLRPDHPNLALCVQSYLRRCATDVDALLESGAQIRLVKGAYAEPADLAFERKADVDASYLTIAKRLVDDAAAGGPKHGIATHDLGMIAQIEAHATSVGAATDVVEYQMLYGIRREAQDRLRRDGAAVRVLISYGGAWFKWYMRRLAERPANLWFVARSVFS